MKLVSVNVGLPREVPWVPGPGTSVLTGIFKQPVEGSVQVRRLNLDGDRQADLTVHGGPYKAVYGYPSEHYAYWRRQLPDEQLPWGSFGENLTTEGMDERSVYIGDRFRIGTAELAITQPREPCFKLGIRFARPDIVKQFLTSRRTGFYFSVVREGQLRAGDAIERIAHSDDSLAVADITSLYLFDRENREKLRRAAQLEALPESWRSYFQEQLEALSS